MVFLVYSEETFLHMFCDAMAILNLDSIFRSFILNGCGTPNRLTSSILALVCAILQNLPENSKLIESIIFHKTIDLAVFLNHGDDKIRLRSFSMLRLLGRFCCFSLQNQWNVDLTNLVIEKMKNDENSKVKSEALNVNEEFKNFGWFKV